MMRVFAMAGNSCLAMLDGMEIFVNFCKRGIRKLSQSFSLVEIGPPNNDCASFVGRFNNCLRFSGLFRADHSFEERLENLVLRLNLSLLKSWRHFLMKKSKDANKLSGGVHLHFQICSVSKVSLLGVLESSSLS